MKVRDAIKCLERNGFRFDRQRGSHRQYEGFVAGRRRIVTVSGHDNDDVISQTLAAMIRQSGLPKKVFR